MTVEDKIDLSTINSRWLRLDAVAEQMQTQIVIAEGRNHCIEKNRHNLYAILDQFACYYGKNEEITRIFDTAIQKLQETPQTLNKGMPPTIAQAGRAFVTPSKNVILGGRQKTKQQYKCSTCGAAGHTKRNCPNKYLNS